MTGAGRDATVVTDAGVLRAQYADHERLAARQRLWSLGSAPALWQRALDLAALTGAATVLDVGCGNGNGNYLGELRRRGHHGTVLGLDLSPGMARYSAGFAATAVADVQALPVRDGSVDLALCMHMLYHVPGPAQAIAQLRRVVRAGCTSTGTSPGIARSR